MGGCSVVGCKNRFIKGGKHFYRFPKDSRLETWIEFTRKGSNYKPKPSATICEEHFSRDCIQSKKDRVCLSKDAVPTIFYKNTPSGIEKMEIQYDRNTARYIGEQCIELLKVLKRVDKESLISKQHQKLEELKGCCRFCFDVKDECVPIAKLESYHIDVNEMITLMGIESDNHELFSDLICEQCFHQLVQIDLFRKKCKEAHDDIFQEIQELDSKIQDASNQSNEIFKHEINDQTIELDNDDALEIFEEHLMDEDDNPEIYLRSDDNLKMVYQNNPDSIDANHYNEISITICDGTEEIIEELEDNDDQQDSTEYQILDASDIKTETFDIDFPKRPEDHAVGFTLTEKTDCIFKNPEKNKFCFKIYECFFCQQKFAGRKTYKAHMCDIKEIKCSECEKVFSKIQAYNSHMTHIHGSLTVTKNYCPICKTVIMSSMNKFKQHRRKCNDGKNNPIECEVCKKICNSLKGYTIHKLYHEIREKNANEGLNQTKGSAICELCGKDFQSMSGYRMHKKNVHRIGSEGQVFQCHICLKFCPTKRSLFDHMRNTHRVQEVPCNVCGKVFRTKILLQKHQIYHNEAKRVFMCSMCPGKPGYFTNVALQRHQKSHFGTKPYQCKLCESAYTTNHQLKHHMAKHTDVQE